MIQHHSHFWTYTDTRPVEHCRDCGIDWNEAGADTVCAWSAERWDHEEAALIGTDIDSYASPVVMPRVGGFAPTGNLAPIGRAYRDGTLDSFQARAILAWMSPARWARFDTRWRASEGSR